MVQRIRVFLLRNAPLLLTMAIFILAYFISGQLYPAMQKPQVFLNLFINEGSLLLVSIGMTFVILTGGIDLSVGGMIALTTAASAAMLRGGVSPVIVMPLLVLMGIVF
jgi:ribose/xylose/arabinose/galactoside ABC-type transport system permease subunit